MYDAQLFDITDASKSQGMLEAFIKRSESAHKLIIIYDSSNPNEYDLSSLITSLTNHFGKKISFVDIATAGLDLLGCYIVYDLLLSESYLFKRSSLSIVANSNRYDSLIKFLEEKRFNVSTKCLDSILCHYNDSLTDYGVKPLSEGDEYALLNKISNPKLMHGVCVTSSELISVGTTHISSKEPIASNGHLYTQDEAYSHADSILSDLYNKTDAAIKPSYKKIGQARIRGRCNKYALVINDISNTPDDYGPVPDSIQCVGLSKVGMRQTRIPLLNIECDTSLAVQQDQERFPPNIMNTDYPVFHDDQLLSIEVELNPDITNDLSITHNEDDRVSTLDEPFQTYPLALHLVKIPVLNIDDVDPVPALEGQVHFTKDTANQDSHFYARIRKNMDAETLRKYAHGRTGSDRHFALSLISDTLRKILKMSHPPKTRIGMRRSLKAAKGSNSKISWALLEFMIYKKLFTKHGKNIIVSKDSIEKYLNTKKR